ncbi:hypothetical protein CHISP_2309 [Chitinispirillum alkaliphilum]|nr:hypothetical protein CHISP_2309 [Chitinispirillum alkaliphilum]
MYFLELNKSISRGEFSQDMDYLLWILKLNQPVYFNNLGYAGNGDEVPGGFESIESIPYALTPFISSEVKNHRIDL